MGGAVRRTRDQVVPHSGVSAYFQAAVAVLAGVLVGVLAGVGQAEPRVQGRVVWHGWTEGVRLAAKQRRPLLVYFHDRYCIYCRRMDEETFADARVRQMIQSCFVPVLVERFENTASRGPGAEKVSSTALLRRYRVFVFPTILVLDFKNPAKEHLRIPGFFGPSEFLEMMAYISQGWYAHMSFGEYLERLLSRTLPKESLAAGCWRGT